MGRKCLSFSVTGKTVNLHDHRWRHEFGKGQTAAQTDDDSIRQSRGSEYRQSVTFRTSERMCQPQCSPLIWLVI